MTESKTGKEAIKQNQLQHIAKTKRRTWAFLEFFQASFLSASKYTRKKKCSQENLEKRPSDRLTSSFHAHLNVLNVQLDLNYTKVLLFTVCLLIFFILLNLFITSSLKLYGYYMLKLNCLYGSGHIKSIYKKTWFFFLKISD